MPIEVSQVVTFDEKAIKDVLLARAREQLKDTAGMASRVEIEAIQDAVPDDVYDDPMPVVTKNGALKARVTFTKAGK